MRTTAFITALALGAASAACEKPDDKAGAASSGEAARSASAAPANPASTVPKTYQLTLGGKPLTLRSALATTRGGKAIKLSFSTHEQKCEDTVATMRMLAPDETTFDLTVAPRVTKDGKGWAITRTYFSGNTRSGDVGDVRVTVSADEKTVTMGASLELESAAFGEEATRKLVLKGDVQARGCGETRPKDAPALRPQTDAKLSVGTQTVAIRGARVKKDEAGHELVLSTDGLDCESRAEGDVALSLHLDAAGKLAKIFLRGDMVTSQATASSDLEGLSVKPSGPLDGQGEVAVAVDGKADVVDFPVALSGTVAVRRCPATR